MKPRLRWQDWLTIALSVISFVFLWFVGISPRGIVWSIFWPGVFLLQLIVLTTPWRAVPLGQVFRMFLFGMGAVPLFTYAFQALLYKLVNLQPIRAFFWSDRVFGSTDLMGPVVAPISEELLKITPVLILLLWKRRASWRRILGPLDTAVLAAASGAGFAFIENLLRVANNDWVALGPDRVQPIASLHLGSFYLFPDMVGSQYFGVPTVWFGHAELSAFVGLALGLGLFIRKKFKVWWLIPGVALLWAVWDHFLVNYLGPEPTQRWAQILPRLDLYGQLLPYVFLAGLVLSLVLAARTLRWYKSIDKSALLGSGRPGFLAAFSKRPSLIPKRIFLLLRCLRLRRLAAYGLRDFSLADPRRSVNWAAWLWAIREQMRVRLLKLTEE